MNMKKTTTRYLVVFYSHEGNTRLVAQTIAQQLSADILELIPQNYSGPKNFLKYVWGGRQVITRAKPKLKKLTKNPKNYDFLIIGTPVWVGSFAPALRSFFTQTKIKHKKIALFCTHDGRPANTLENMKHQLDDSNEIISQTNFLRPLLNKKQISAQVKTWIKNF